MDDDLDNVDLENDYENYDEIDPDQCDEGNDMLGSSGNYELMMKDQMEKERFKKIDEVVQFSSLSKDEAELVLVYYNWNLDLLNNDWFDKMEKIKINSGIKISKEAQKKINDYFKKHKQKKNLCLVCECDLEPGDYLSLTCNHALCTDCYTQYLKAKLSDQLTLLSTRCPLTGCNLIVTHSIFNKCFKKDFNSQKIYTKCLLRNFTESNSDIKLCPNPKCDICVKVPGHGMVEVKCQCGYVFCFKCLQETHRPCDCEMAFHWEEKSKEGGEDVKWILANTKQCPKCHKYIEKNQGCNHMTCRREAGGCGYEFCWICLGEWKPHGSSWYECKLYKPSDVDKKKERMKNQAKLELERYVNCFENYHQQIKALKFAQKLNDRIKDFKNLLQTKKQQPYSELGYFDEALNTVIDCHRVLKNTHIFMYYMKQNNNKVKLFQHTQSILSTQSDILHELLELNELPDIMKIDNFDEFNKKYLSYKGHIISLISSIAKYRENILVDIENDPSLIDFDLLKEIKTKK